MLRGNSSARVEPDAVSMISPLEKFHNIFLHHWKHKKPFRAIPEATFTERVKFFYI